MEMPLNQHQLQLTLLIYTILHEFGYFNIFMKIDPHSYPSFNVKFDIKYALIGQTSYKSEVVCRH